MHRPRHYCLIAAFWSMFPCAVGADSWRMPEPADDASGDLEEYVQTLAPHFQKVEVLNGRVVCDGILISDGYLVFMSETRKEVLYIRPDIHSRKPYVSTLDGSLFKPIGLEDENMYYSFSDPEDHPSPTLYEIAGDTDHYLLIASPRPVVPVRSPFNQKPMVARAGDDRGVDRSDFVRVLPDTSYRIHRGPDFTGPVYPKTFSPVTEIAICLPDELLSIRPDKLYNYRTGFPIDFKNYRVYLNRAGLGSPADSRPPTGLQPA